MFPLSPIRLYLSCYAPAPARLLPNLILRQHLFKGDAPAGQVAYQFTDDRRQALLAGQLRNDSALGSVVRVDKFSVVAVLRFNVEFYRFHFGLFSPGFIAEHQYSITSN